MESLLAVAFDNLSSYDAPKIKKGLKQIEGILAQICLSTPSPTTRNALQPPAFKKHPSSSSSSRPESRSSATFGNNNNSNHNNRHVKSLSELTHDPAFFEFFKLQEGFEWNVAQRLLDMLKRLLSRSNDGQSDSLITDMMEVLQGILLLHPPSRLLFAREKNMNLLLDLLEPCNCPSIQSTTLLVLVIALNETPQNTRSFEELDGLLTVCSIFKSRHTSREVKVRLMEFLYAYLMPETPLFPSAAAVTASIPRSLEQQQARDSKLNVPCTPAMLQRSPSKISKIPNDRLQGAVGARATRRRADSEAEGTRTTEEKTALLSAHMGDVGDLVRDLSTWKPFGGVVC